MTRGLTRLVSLVYGWAERCALRAREDAYRARLKEVGDNVTIHGVIFSSCQDIRIGSHVYIGPGTNMVGRGGIVVEDHSILGPEVLIMSSLHNWRDAAWLPYDNTELLKPVRVGRACWIGARAVILPGVDLGDGSVVGAGAVVTRSCEPGTVLAGNPARPIHHRDPLGLERTLREGPFYVQRKHEMGVALNVKQERPADAGGSEEG